MKFTSKHQYILYLILAFSITLTNCTSATKKSIKKSPPNIIFFIADDMYPEMFNCLPEGKGKNLTPNMDRLVKEGTLMVNQYVASPVCTPSRYNCMTGRYASKATNQEFLNFTKKNEGQTVIQWNSFITPKDQNLAKYLKKLGYTTGLCGKNHVIECKDLYKFPDFWADPHKPEINAKVKENYQKVVNAVKNNGFDYAEGVYHDNPNFVGLGNLAVQNMDWIAEAGVNFIDQHYKNPFFLYFATTIPHHPTQPERSWNANPLITANGFLEKAPNVMPARHTIIERTKAAGLQGKHKENLLWLDDALGALLQKLEERNVLDNTVIFFFNDHGQKAKGALYQGGVTSPSFVWKSGGFACGNVCKNNVQNIDFAPTIIEMAGGEISKDQFDGTSFKPLLDGQKASEEKTHFFELGYARAIIKGNFKYYAIRYPQFANNRTEEERKAVLDAYNAPRLIKKMHVVNLNDPLAPYSHFSLVPGGESAEHESYGKAPAYFELDQLYDLSKDPTEQVNLVKDPKYKEVYLELKNDIKIHLSKMPGKFDL